MYKTLFKTTLLYTSIRPRKSALVQVVIMGNNLPLHCSALIYKEVIASALL